MRRGQFYDKPDVDLDAGIPRHGLRMGPEIAETGTIFVTDRSILVEFRYFCTYN